MQNTHSIFTEKLRNSGLRPTQQRIRICQILFDRKETFHFSINELMKTIQVEVSEKISLATVYNTVDALLKKGYLKEINIANDIKYFDTNTSSHHHFYDIKTKELTDIEKDNVEIKKMPTPPSGKKIEDVTVTFKISQE